MFDWILDNPIGAIIALVFILRLFFGGKDKEKETQKAALKKAERERNERIREIVDKKVEGAPDKPFREQLREAMKEFEAVIGEVQGTDAKNGKNGSAARPKAGTSEPFRSSERAIVEPAIIEPPPIEPAIIEAPRGDAPSPYEFRSQTGAPVTRVDYDLKSEAFSYHSAIEEPAEQMFHLTGFKPYVSAGAGGQPTIAAASVIVSQEDQSLAGTELFRDPNALRNAILMQEILGKPRSLRPRGR